MFPIMLAAVSLSLTGSLGVVAVILLAIFLVMFAVGELVQVQPTYRAVLAFVAFLAAIFLIAALLIP